MFDQNFQDQELVSKEAFNQSGSKHINQNPTFQSDLKLCIEEEKETQDSDSNNPLEQEQYKNKSNNNNEKTPFDNLVDEEDNLVDEEDNWEMAFDECNNTICPHSCSPQSPTNNTKHIGNIFQIQFLCMNPHIFKSVSAMFWSYGYRSNRDALEQKVLNNLVRFQTV